MRSATGVFPGSRSSATTFTRSRSVTIPAVRPASVMITEEIRFSCRIFAASEKVALVSAVFTSRVMMSPTCMAAPPDVDRVAAGSGALAYSDAAYTSHAA
jgi:hypothetical protein